MKRLYPLAVFLPGLLFLSLLAFPGPANAESPDSAARLHALFREEWEYTLQENPEFASLLGDRRYNDRWQDLSLAAIERRQEHDREVLRRLDEIDLPSLSDADRINYSLFRRQYEL